MKNLLFAVVIGVSSWANASDVSPDSTWWKPVGHATLSWGFWDIYHSTLYTPDGYFGSLSVTPLKLQIKYKRDITKQRLLDATEKQWQHLGYPKENISLWLVTLETIWPEINKGDKLSYLLENGIGWFRFWPLGGKDGEIGKIDDPELARAFIEIWLSEDTAYPKLRLALLGGEQ
ncbi:chalcone isomerase family protein [Parasalinivibrio latis]|uniref:chalcone isomerase family protein n=1 Tax=Parasalinivibrio latis TaxID=2952610 RepID=UPI0030E3C081